MRPRRVVLVCSLGCLGKNKFALRGVVWPFVYMICAFIGRYFHLEIDTCMSKEFEGMQQYKSLNRTTSRSQYGNIILEKKVSRATFKVGE
mmetsp:Transcript_11600/g.19217  ORF Transcript_11600/g.19217 Transcript_11600/m.19217 type:complete len:90 (-) Transcript_11600:139-408(-)